MVVIISANTCWYLYNFRKNTFKRLISKGYKVYALAPIDEYSYKFNELGVEFIPIDIDAGGVNPIKDLKTLIQFYRVFKKVRPSAVLNFTPKNNIYSTFAAKVLGIPAINNIAGLGTLFEKRSLTSYIALGLYRLSQPFAYHVFFQNMDDRELFLSRGVVKKKNSSRLYGSGVDLNRFIPSQRLNDGVIKFLLVARLLKSKGVEIYAEAAKQIRAQYGQKVEFRLVGFLDVDNPNAVSKIAVDNWQKEGVLNYLGKSDKIENEIEKADCMVLPSFYREGVPKTLLEAGAMGKPIITTDNVGCRETVLDDKSGFLCQPKSVESLIEKLEMFIELPIEEKLAMGRESRLLIERKFDEEKNIKQYLSLLAGLASK